MNKTQWKLQSFGIITLSSSPYAYPCVSHDAFYFTNVIIIYLRFQIYYFVLRSACIIFDDESCDQIPTAN